MAMYPTRAASSMMRRVLKIEYQHTCQGSNLLITFTLTEAKEYIHKGFETQAAVLIASAAMKPMIMTMQTKIPIAMKE